MSRWVRRTRIGAPKVREALACVAERAARDARFVGSRV